MSYVSMRQHASAYGCCMTARSASARSLRFGLLVQKYEYGRCIPLRSASARSLRFGLLVQKYEYGRCIPLRSASTRSLRGEVAAGGGAHFTCFTCSMPVLSVRNVLAVQAACRRAARARARARCDAHVRQYSYFCTSIASKLSACGARAHADMVEVQVTSGWY
jgi:hypothetical protein